MIFITGNKARQSKARDTVEQRKERILQQLTKIFGEQARTECMYIIDLCCTSRGVLSDRCRRPCVQW